MSYYSSCLHTMIASKTFILSKLLYFLFFFSFLSCICSLFFEVNLLSNWNLWCSVKQYTVYLHFLKSGSGTDRSIYESHRVAHFWPILSHLNNLSQSYLVGPIVPYTIFETKDIWQPVDNFYCYILEFFYLRTRGVPVLFPTLRFIFWILLIDNLNLF